MEEIKTFNARVTDVNELMQQLGLSRRTSTDLINCLWKAYAAVPNSTFISVIILSCPNGPHATKRPSFHWRQPDRIIAPPGTHAGEHTAECRRPRMPHRRWPGQVRWTRPERRGGRTRRPLLYHASENPYGNFRVRVVPHYFPSCRVRKVIFLIDDER
jgi:hypothetical protein